MNDFFTSFYVTEKYHFGMDDTVAHWPQTLLLTPLLFIMFLPMSLKKAHWPWSLILTPLLVIMFLPLSLKKAHWPWSLILTRFIVLLPLFNPP